MDSINMEDRTIIMLTALIVAAAVEIVALFLGYDGYLLAGFLAIIGSVVGVPAGIFIEQKRRE